MGELKCDILEDVMYVCTLNIVCWANHVLNGAFVFYNIFLEARFTKHLIE